MNRNEFLERRKVLCEFKRRTSQINTLFCRARIQIQHNINKKREERESETKNAHRIVRERYTQGTWGEY